jgi:hypothetical protein
MANTKISALTSATTPLAGTEVLPIVQSGATVKVATNDLTVRNVRANATTGILQVTGPAAASTRVVTVPDANFTAARTDAAQSFTGDQTLSTGNLVIGTSGKGIDFSATAGTGTSELLADYEEGTWTPVFSSATAPTGVTYSVQAGTYTKVGNMVNVSCFLEISSKGTGGGGAIQVTGLPYTIGSASGNYSSIQPEVLNVTMPANANNLYVRTNPSASYLGVEFLDTSVLSTSAGRGAVQYSDSGNSFRLICQTTYRV